MEKLPNIRKIAVLKATALGDYLVLTPALYALRAAYPEADTTVLDLPQAHCRHAVSFVNGVQVDEVLTAAFDLLDYAERFGRQGKP